MVDFKKLRQKRQEQNRQRIANDCNDFRRPEDPVVVLHSTPVLETAFHRELADEAYQAALLDYVDEHLFV